MTQREPSLDEAACVTLFGVGGAGGNAVSRLFRQPETGMKIICANTDVQALRAAPNRRCRRPKRYASAPCLSRP